LLRLLVDRFDAMADAETDMKTFEKVIETLRKIYETAREYNKNDIIQFISKKFGKHILRKDVALIEKKKCVIRAISELKDENYVTELVSLLWDQGSFVEAREALVILSDVSTPLLIETLKDTDDKAVRMKILDVLVRIGKDAIAEIRKLLASPKWYVRRNGVHLLGEIHADEAVIVLGDMVLDESEQVQQEVILSLQKMGGDKNTKKYFLKALDSTYKSTVIAAAKNLSRQESAPKIPDIVAWLKERKSIPEKGEEEFRRSIIAVLGQHGDSTIIGALVAVLHEKALFRGNLLYPTKEAALRAIHQIGGEEAMQALEDAAGGRDQPVAVYARELLSNKDKTT
jgi:HEAT repeat protein